MAGATIYGRLILVNFGLVPIPPKSTCTAVRIFHPSLLLRLSCTSLCAGLVLCAVQSDDYTALQCIAFAHHELNYYNLLAAVADG